jgi:hypothetical protein
MLQLDRLSHICTHGRQTYPAGQDSDKDTKLAQKLDPAEACWGTCE